MTNREKFKEVFGKDIKWSDLIEPQRLALKSAQINGIDCMEEWLNAEYKEPTTENCIACKYDETEKEDGEHCKKCLAGDSQFELDNEFVEPTTKNNCAEQNGCITCSLDDGDDCCRKLYEESMQEPTTKNCESCRHYGLHHEICNYCYKCSLWIEKDHNLCDSCTNKGCEFQSGIVRTECAFYMPPHLEPDNCGNYLVQALTTKNDLAVKKIMDEVKREFEKVVIPSTDKLIIFALVQNALYKCAL